MRVNRLGLASIALGAGALIIIGTVAAQVGGAYDASFTTTDSGGGTASNGGYVLQNAIGQPVAGNAASGSYSLDVGVMAGGSGAAAVASPSPSPSPIPGTQKRYAPNVARDGIYP